MHLSIQGRQLDVGDALRQHAEDTLSTLLEKYFGDAIDASVTLAREGKAYRSSLLVHIGKGINLEATESAHDIYAAFDLAAEKLAKRLRRHKRRLKDHHQRMQATENEQVRQYVIAALPEGEEEEVEAALGDKPTVVAELTAQVPSLTVGEAVMRLDLQEEPALLFRNRAHGRINMIYRRSDGNIGWVDPEGIGQG